MSASFDIDIECIQSVAEQQANKFPVGSFFSWLPAAVSSSIVAAEGDVTVQLGVTALLSVADQCLFLVQVATYNEQEDGTDFVSFHNSLLFANFQEAFLIVAFQVAELPVSEAL